MKTPDPCTPTRSVSEENPRIPLSPRLRFGLVCALSLFAVAVAHGQDKPLEPQPVKHRVTGIFSPDRQDDLREVVKNSLPDVKLVSIDYKNSEATFVYDADKLFNKPKPEQIPERFDNLLRSVSSEGFGRLKYHRAIRRRAESARRRDDQHCNGTDRQFA